MLKTECRPDIPHTVAVVFDNHFTHIHETNCRNASKTYRSSSVQNGKHPPRASYVHPTDQVVDNQALS